MNSLSKYFPKSKKIPIDKFISNALYDELFRMARGKSEFSNEALDKKKQMTDYLNNDQRLIESLIRRGKIKA